MKRLEFQFLSVKLIGNQAVVLAGQRSEKAVFLDFRGKQRFQLALANSQCVFMFWKIIYHLSATLIFSIIMSRRLPESNRKAKKNL